MYIVAFMYPSGNRTFDYDHFVNVHLPLGVGLTEKYLSIKPDKIVVYTPISGGDGKLSSSPYCAISSVYFSSEEDAKAFSTLFTFEEAARRLSEDFANYTPSIGRSTASITTATHGPRLRRCAGPTPPSF